MEDNEYLKELLREQDLPDNSVEVKELSERKAKVSRILRGTFAGIELHLRSAGSMAKGTLNRISYDQDLPFFLSPDAAKHLSLEDIFKTAKSGLSPEFYVESKNSALRLMSFDPKQRVDLRTDVVPGRLTDEKTGDAFLHYAGLEKERLKTNLDTHILHVRDSGFTPEIRLAKLMNCHYSFGVKTFPYELAVIKILQTEKANEGLAGNFLLLLEKIEETIETISIVDPANENNDLAGIFDATVRMRLANGAARVRGIIEGQGFEAAFWPLKEKSSPEKIKIISQVAPSILNPARPYAK